MSKFKDIEFPFYGLKYPPLDIKYEKNRILVQLLDKPSSMNGWFKLDQFDLENPTYIGRLMSMQLMSDIPAIEYDYTALNLEHILFSKIKWGVDNKGKLFDLKKKEIFDFKSKKISKVKKDLIWVKGISYPFKLPQDYSEAINKYIYADLALIDDVWYLYKFSYKHSSKKTIMI